MSQSNFSRRKFLEISAAAAGGSLAAKTILLTPEPAEAAPRRVAPSDSVATTGSRPRVCSTDVTTTGTRRRGDWDIGKSLLWPVAGLPKEAAPDLGQGSAARVKILLL